MTRTTTPSRRLFCAWAGAGVLGPALATFERGPAEGRQPDRPSPSTIAIPQKRVPVVRVVDVLVVGGGPSGIGAAIASARSGAVTLLVERYGFLGGVGTAALETTYIKPRSEAREMDGIFAEVLTRLKMLGGTGKEGFIGIDWGRICYVLGFDPETMKYLLDTMVQEAKVELLLHTLAIDSIQDGSIVKGLVIHNKQGTQAILAKVIVDATGDGDVAATCGAGFEIGRPKDHLQMAVSLCYRLGGVKTAPGAIVSGDDGFLRYARPPRGYIAERDGLRSVVPITSLRVDGTNAWDLTRAEMEGRRQARGTLDSYRKTIPEFADAYLVQTATQVGVRSSRRIHGDSILTEDDVLNGRKSAAGVAQASFYCDVFEPDKRIVTHKYLKREGDWYEIPYGCLLPKGIEQLLVAGRCISAEYYAQSSLRLMHTCMALGQAAGTAAAFSAIEGVSPRKVDPLRLRVELERAREKSRAPRWCP